MPSRSRWKKADDAAVCRWCATSKVGPEADAFTSKFALNTVTAMAKTSRRLRSVEAVQNATR